MGNNLQPLFIGLSDLIFETAKTINENITLILTKQNICIDLIAEQKPPFYIGESGTTVPELRYLNVDQALADLAQFIEYVKSDSFEQGRFKSGNVALVGCSYAGSMATWMRLAYPHLITVAFSDSGPLHAQEDFPGD
ncbi:unnamed protein product [Euphydryas editha]|uniref:Uncharacterized protein n=1 Tax=Euphydryas editha TaxID=104508 RepID=A0AAU9UHQ8_EUPED|nr:unnamed protein product [Euphydryas editha]